MKWRFRRHKRRRSMLLFWVVLRAFILVIVLSICGMLAFFITVIDLTNHNEGFVRDFRQPAFTYADALTDYYIDQGNSWAGVDQQLHRFPVVIVVDERRQVVGSLDPALPPGQVLERRELVGGIPIIVQGQRVGTVLPWQLGQDSGPPMPEALFGLLGAGSVLAIILSGLAVIFARQFSRPLRNLTSAAQTLALGRLDVQVPGASIKELNDLAEAFNRMAQALANADQQRKQMTADVAHELRTPLAIIKGRLEGLQDGVYHATPEQIARLLNETLLLERLIEDLRLLALAEAGQLPLYPEVILPYDLLEETVAAFADQAATRQICLRIAAPEDLPPIDVDPQRMEQVLSNLVSNALRYTPDGGSITLSGEMLLAHGTASYPQVVLRVSDTGQGIAPEDLPHIFDRFWRADRSRQRGSGGSGLGLAIARQIVVAHGGTIQAASRPGAGTTMSITLPGMSDA